MILECEFSSLSDIMTHLRTSMSEASIKEQMCLRNWLEPSRNYIFGDAIGLKEMMDQDLDRRRVARAQLLTPSPF